MKCPHCGFDKIQPTYKFCPKCRTVLQNRTSSSEVKSAPAPVLSSMEAKVKNEQPAAPVQEGNSGIGGVDIVKNKAIWSIAPGEIARHLTSQEFDNLSNLKGLIIEDGVTAIVYVDGHEVATLSGGVYNFATEKIVTEARAKVEKEEKEDKKHQGVLGKAKLTARKIWRFFTGEKKGEREKQREARKAKVRDAIQKITDKSVVSVYLKADRVFPATLNTDGTGFVPYSIKTKFVDVEVGVSLQLQIDGFSDFIQYYMTGKKSVTVSEIEKELAGRIRTILQGSLKNAEIDQFGIGDELKDSISQQIIALKDSIYGIAIVRVLDITCDNEDFERFRKIEKELYCSEKELSYLQRTNEFKNRLASVNNEQIVEEAKTELDLRKALDEVNKDGLLHEDELEQFVELLAIQKRIRQAKNEVEEEKALLELKGNQLVNEDDFESIVSDLENKKFDREQVSEALRIKSLASTARARLAAETQLTKERILAEEEISEVEFETMKKQLDRDTEEVDLEAALYGRQFVLQKQKTLDALELEGITLDKELENRRKIDDYTDARVDKDYERTKRRTEDDYDFSKRKAQDEMEILRQKAELARQNMEAMKAQELKEKEIDIDLEKTRIHTQATMSADQLAAQGLKDLDAAAQAEFMKSLSSGKENEYLKQAASDKDALYQQMLSMQKESASAASAQQMEMMKQMMDFARTSTVATASAARGRMDDLNAMKEEYREQMKHEQGRVDSTQDKALNYTTKVTMAEAKRHISKESAKGAAENPVDAGSKSYKIPEFGEQTFSFDQVVAYIANGVVEPTTEFEVDGELITTADITELYPLLKKYYTVECPVCGSKGLKGTFCPECGSDL